MMQNYITWFDASACADTARGRQSWSEKARSTLTVWYQRWQGRRDLRSLDARLLADIGLDAKRAEIEASKPFWEH